MNYFSTRDKSLEFSFKDIFLRGLAPDGGLFLPSEIKKYSQSEIKDLSKLSYVELATEIIFNFCKKDIEKDQLQALIEKAYRNFENKEVVNLKKVGDINLLELYHGPTLAFKDIAMQVIGNMYDHLQVASDKKVNIVVATSGDTGSAAIAALNDRKNINVFVLHPYNKISNIQRKIMTTIGSSNVYNIAVRGSFDDCQKIVKDMFNENKFRETINMSGVNSINWARIIAQSVYYFYSYCLIEDVKQPINFSVPTGNFGDIYAGYLAKKMGLPIDKLIVATNQNDILHRAISNGSYEVEKVAETISPSMDIQIASNFERLIYDLNEESDKKTINAMKDINEKGKYILDQKKLEKINISFLSSRMSEEEVLKTIKSVYEKFEIVLDPHSAIGYGAFDKVNVSGNNIVLATAHPCKFPEAIKNSINLKADLPDELKYIMNEKENYDIIENHVEKVKEYIKQRVE